MNGLFFCTYLHIYDDCYNYNKNVQGIGRRESLVIDLLSSCVSDTERSTFRYEIDTNSSTINQYFTGKRIPPDSIRQERFLNRNAADHVRDYFKNIFIDKIPDTLREIVRGRLVQLIKKDRTMPVEQKDKLLSYAVNSDLDPLLADALIYAVIQPKPEDKFKFYFPNPPKNNLPNLRTKYFMGRESELEIIFDRFNGEVFVQSISGVSGSGKTQLALEYAHSKFNEYDYIWWVDCESQNTIFVSYNTIAKQLRLNNNENDPSLAVREVLSWCQANGYWLMIFDNVKYGRNSHIYKLEDFIPSYTTNGELLFTTLDDVPFRDEEMLFLKVFDEQMGVDFIKKRLRLITTSKSMNALVRRLGGLPLGLEEACAFLRAMPNETIDSYIKKLDQYHIGFGDDLFRNSTHEQTVLEVTNMIIDKLPSNNAKKILMLNSLFKDQGVSLWMFHMARRYCDKAKASEDFNKLILDDFEFEKAVRILREYSLCRSVDIFSDEYDHFGYLGQLYCHNLTQEIVRSNLICNTDVIKLGVEVCYWAIWKCSAVTGDYWPLISDILALLKNAESKSTLIDEKPILEKIAHLYRYTSWVLPDVAPEQEQLWQKYVGFTERAYGFGSAQAAFAYLERANNDPTINS